MFASHYNGIFQTNLG